MERMRTNLLCWIFRGCQCGWLQGRDQYKFVFLALSLIVRRFYPYTTLLPIPDIQI